MIGIIARPTEEVVVREFFELFKTPWEFYSSGHRYDVVVCSQDADMPRGAAALVVIYAGERVSFDTRAAVRVIPHTGRRRVLRWRDGGIPVYGSSVTFEEEDADLEDGEPHPAMYLRRETDGITVRVGYDLFAEVRCLLTVGQPAEAAESPTLDLHVAVLRELIVGSGVPLVEIPPIPDGYRFLACLTHDVDHPLLRKHRFDHTMFGFLYRATIGSICKVFQGRLGFQDLMKNIRAAITLPLIYLGITEDIWSKFDRYIEIEEGVPSSFFVIPFKRLPGCTRGGRAPRHRASCYGIDDISSQVKRLLSAGCEIGIHGIDSWIDSSKGRAEVAEVQRVAGESARGVRMHWLYYDEQSPLLLEEAGADYDSTSGYNETIGYRAGTTQVYKPLGVQHLLELPLHVMDTALFYPSYMNLSAAEARTKVKWIIENAVRRGGCLTVNWHDRSIAPERLWGGVYQDLIRDLKASDAWFATAAQAVSWFRKRRSARFEKICWESGELRVTIAADQVEAGPELQVHIHNGQRDMRDRAVVPRTIPAW